MTEQTQDDTLPARQVIDARGIWADYCAGQFGETELLRLLSKQVNALKFNDSQRLGQAAMSMLLVDPPASKEEAAKAIEFFILWLEARGIELVDGATSAANLRSIYQD